MNLQITPYESVNIYGCGAIGRLVAARWQEMLPDTRKINAIVNTASSRQLLEGVYSVCQINLDEAEPVLPECGANSLVYYFVPPPPSGVRDTRCQHMLATLDKQAEKPERIVAISTTGVYGDCGGALVTEDRNPMPNVDRAQRRYDMEQQLKQWCEHNQMDLIILRVGGIYGPGRLPLERIKQGIPMLTEDLAPKTNRIHEQDLADICVAAAMVDHRYRIYNVSDGSNSNMAEYFNILADHFGLPRPPAVGWEEAEQTISKGMLSYLKESRRIDNSRMLNELGIKLRYPTLQDALADIRPQQESCS